MPRPFAEHYDLIYCDKDYASDAALVAGFWNRPDMDRMRMLEIGAGTGNHSMLLAPRVRELVSVEIDADLASVARRKLAESGLGNIRLVEQPLAALPPEPFDHACALFHVLNYVFPAAMPEFLGALAARMKPGSRFVADLWNGEAALADPPRRESRTKSCGTAQIRQHILPELDAAERRVTLNYDIEISGPKLSARFQERLALHLWTLPVLQDHFTRAGFGDIAFYDYVRFPARASKQSWRVWMMAEKT
jgi:predicted O-methyltransferase YrrM